PRRRREEGRGRSSAAWQTERRASRSRINAQIAQESVAEIVDPGVHVHFDAAALRVAEHVGRLQPLYLLAHVDLAQPPPAFIAIADGLELRGVFAGDVL